MLYKLATTTVNWDAFIQYVNKGLEFATIARQMGIFPSALKRFFKDPSCPVNTPGTIAKLQENHARQQGERKKKEIAEQTYERWSRPVDWNMFAQLVDKGMDIEHITREMGFSPTVLRGKFMEPSCPVNTPEINSKLKENHANEMARQEKAIERTQEMLWDFNRRLKQLRPLQPHDRQASWVRSNCKFAGEDIEPLTSQK